VDLFAGFSFFFFLSLSSQNFSLSHPTTNPKYNSGHHPRHSQAPPNGLLGGSSTTVPSDVHPKCGWNIAAS